MSVPAYPAYKDSGVAWLGDVPAHWRLGKIKHAAAFSTGWTPPSGNDAFYGGDNLWANIADLGPKILSDTAKRITDAAVANSDMRAAPKGSLLFSFKLSIGQVSFAGCDMFTNEAIAAFPPQDELWMPYAYYAFPFFIPQNAAENIYGAKLLNQELIRNALIALPPPAEQAAISTFLDRETGKIDALVEEQRRLIALLKEKRQAVISHAVTKGLNPAVPLKPSGIEWLGDIPAHWEVRPLKRDLAFLTSGSRGWAEHYADEGAIFIRIGNLTRHSYDLDLADLQRVSVPSGAEGARTLVKPGDLLFSITAFLGSVAVVGDLGEPAYVSQHVALARLRSDNLRPVWVALLTLSFVGQTYLAEQGYGGTKVQLGLDDIACMPVLVPPQAEQDAIVSHLEKLTTEFTALVEAAEHAISLLQERRAALISAAVTGKIDVRGLVGHDDSKEAA